MKGLCRYEHQVKVDAVGYDGIGSIVDNAVYCDLHLSFSSFVFPGNHR